jgi:hypothetical protein
VIEHSTKENGKIDKSKILGNVYDVVKEAFPNQDMEKVNAIYDFYRVWGDGLISLDIFIENGTGVCIHQALTVAAVLESLKEKGVVGGRPSVDRNSGYSNGKNYGHAWVRYTNSAGEIFIIDTALEFKGSLKKAIEFGKWNYLRPGEGL